MKTFLQAGLLLVFAVFPAALAVIRHPDLADRLKAGLDEGEVRLAEVRGWQRNVLWIDARPSAAFGTAHIPGAVPLDEGRFEQDFGRVLAEWTPDRPVVVYCDSTACSASRDLARRLREAGLPEVYSLHGGWAQWQTDRP